MTQYSTTNSEDDSARLRPLRSSKKRLSREIITRRNGWRDHSWHWQLISDATHEAVCELSKSDGFRLCELYAQIGAVLAQHAFGTRFAPNGGFARIAADAERRHCFVFNVEHEQHHCWIANEHGWLIDLSARHYHRHFGLAGRLVVHSERKHPPDFIRWHATDAPLQNSWIDVAADAAVCQRLQRRARAWSQQPVFRRIVFDAISRLDYSL